MRKLRNKLDEVMWKLHYYDIEIALFIVVVGMLSSAAIFCGE